MITLTKIDEKHRIVLDKNSDDLVIIKAQWVDNNDGMDNDDLDLRAGLLLPDGKMAMIHCDNPGSIEKEPFILHTGDVKEASVNAPGEETMKVNPKISQYFNGPVAIVFSVYSAVSNGAVSVASLKPKMKIQYKDKLIECAYDFSANMNKDTKPEEKKGFFSKIFNKVKSLNDNFIYTYVIGIVIIKDGEVEIMPSGLTSKPHSEDTPSLKWESNGSVSVSVDGPPLFKQE